MPIHGVTRVVLETQVIRAGDEDEAKRLMGSYAADEVNATVNETTALRLPDETPVPEQLPEHEKKSVIIAGGPTEGFAITGTTSSPSSKAPSRRTRRASRAPRRSAWKATSTASIASTPPARPPSRRSAAARSKARCSPAHARQHVRQVPAELLARHGVREGLEAARLRVRRRRPSASSTRRALRAQQLKDVVLAAQDRRESEPVTDETMPPTMK